MAMNRFDPAGEAPMRLPEDCRVRLIDMEEGVRAAIAVDEEGAANIYINARLGREARCRALRHELRHWYAGDVFREADIRDIEGAEASEGLLAMDGSLLADPAPVFDPALLEPVGRGLYLPLGENREKAARDVLALRLPLEEASRIYDIRQWPPLLPAESLERACDGLWAAPAEAVDFIAWRPEADGGRPPLPVVLQFAGGGLEGAIYYEASGSVCGAVALLCLESGGHAFRLTADLDRWRGALAVNALWRAVDGGAAERVY